MQKKRMKLMQPGSIDKASYAAAVLASLTAFRYIMIQRHDPEKVQQLARAALENITEAIN